MITLALDASTYRGTVAVFDESRLLVQDSAPMRGRDAELLMPAVLQALANAGITLGQLDRVVCGSGPGSFTSLRIAASIAKGVAVGRGVPLYAVSSLALIVAGNVSDGPRGARKYLAVLDAMRRESYVAEFEHDAGAVRPLGGHRVVSSTDVMAVAEGAGARAVGPEMPDQWHPHARGVGLLLEQFEADPVDVASWEPTYGRLAEAQVKWEAEQGRALSP
ncbi:MAG TPA: tRNA (adenosine(37)-N6)-threonylcarbamoyltransferase complex dimerization subunit type 1 TsaB [Gemmatimonadaceae bacterium]|nr:tRNA (adenosine(37)-N6)-threonylcarbamoyltransferase complex dimerization subunit type 1 TsaB [Gemmatimonadaceae bacterium]